MRNLTEVNEPGSFDRLTISTDALYHQMMQAHEIVAEAVGYINQEITRWIRDGKPTKISVRGNQIPAEGYRFWPGMKLADANHWLEEKRSKLEFLGNAYNDYIEVSYDEFKELTTPKYRIIEEVKYEQV